MALENKFIFRINAPQRQFLGGVKKGVQSHVIRQCLDIGALLAARGLLKDSGLDMEKIEQLIGGKRCAS